MPNAHPRANTANTDAHTNADTITTKAGTTNARSANAGTATPATTRPRRHRFDARPGDVHHTTISYPASRHCAAERARSTTGPIAAVNASTSDAVDVCPRLNRNDPRARASSWPIASST